MNSKNITHYKTLSEFSSQKVDLFTKQKEKLRKEFGGYHEILEPNQKLDIESRKNDETKVFKHLHHQCLLMGLNFIRGNRIKQISLIDFYLICATSKNPLGIYNATRSLIEFTAFLNDITFRLKNIFDKPKSNWKGKGEEFFNVIVRARFGTSDKKFQDLLSTAGIPVKKIKPINIMQSIATLKECGYEELAQKYDEMCDFVHHNLSSNTTANLGSKVYDQWDIISDRIAVKPGNITTVYCYPIEEKANMAIENTVEIVEDCINLIDKNLEIIKVTPFSETQIEEFTGTPHGFTHLKPNKKTPIIATYKAGRNEPCICGSGKKYKKCCGL